MQRLNAILTKIPMTFFTELKHRILKFVWNHKKSRIAKAILRKKSKTQYMMFLGFKVYYKGKIIKTK